jgi:biopolymer transport protein ExbB
MYEAFEVVKQGGWTMLPLGLCSVAALAVVIERVFALRRARVIDPRIERLIEDYHGEDAAPPALALCRHARGPFARIIEEILKARHLDNFELLETMNSTGRRQLASLERGLTLLEIIAGVSPLLGLLGTVLGIVTVFGAISVSGVGDPRVLSAGISKALITTVAGLGIAIPAVAAHGLLAKRVDDLAAEMQERATAFIMKLHATRDPAGDPTRDPARF